MKSFVLKFLALVFVAVLSANVSAQIQISSAFQMNTNLPIDTRAVATDLTARDAISALRRYEGLVVYVVSEGTNYQLVGGTDNANWVEFSGSGGGLAKWTTGTLYEVDAVVWLEDDDKIYVCIEEHTAGASFDPTKWQELSSAEDKLDKFPSETNDNRLVRTDGNGDAVQGSLAILDDVGALSGLTQLDVDNVRVDGNTISTTDTNGHLVLDPNGTGRVEIPSVGANHVPYTGANSRLKGEAAFSYDESTNTLRVDGVDIGSSSTITTYSGNNDLTLSAHGTGDVIINKDARINDVLVSGNEISSITTNADLILSPNGTGDIQSTLDTRTYNLDSQIEHANYIPNESFERDDITHVSCTNATPTVVNRTGGGTNNQRQLQIVSTDTNWSCDIAGAASAGGQGYLKLFLNSDLAAEYCALIDGSEQACDDIRVIDGLNQYDMLAVLGTTSNSVRIKGASTATTVLVDQIELKAGEQLITSVGGIGSSLVQSYGLTPGIILSPSNLSEVMSFSNHDQLANASYDDIEREFTINKSGWYRLSMRAYLYRGDPSSPADGLSGAELKIMFRVNNQILYRQKNYNSAAFDSSSLFLAARSNTHSVAYNEDVVYLEGGDKVSVLVDMSVAPSSFDLRISERQINIIPIKNPNGETAILVNDENHTVAGNYLIPQVGSSRDRIINVDAATATITIDDGMVVGSTIEIRKINSGAGTITINRSGSEAFTRAALTSVTLTSDGDFWRLKKVSNTRWELVDGYEIVEGSNQVALLRYDGRMEIDFKEPSAVARNFSTAGGGSYSDILSLTFVRPFKSGTIPNAVGSSIVATSRVLWISLYNSSDTVVSYRHMSIETGGSSVLTRASILATGVWY